MALIIPTTPIRHAGRLALSGVPIHVPDHSAKAMVESGRAVYAKDDSVAPELAQQTPPEAFEESTSAATPETSEAPPEVSEEPSPVTVKDASDVSEEKPTKSKRGKR